MMTLESAFTDTSYGLELEKIRNKIKQLYTDLITQAYKLSNPSASPEEIQDFLETNELEFKGDGFEEESEDLESLLEALSKEDDLEEVKDKAYEKPDVENGKELKSKSKEKTTAPATKALDIQSGGLFKPKDKNTLPKTSALKIPTGTIQRSITDNPSVSTVELKDIWDEERSKLLALVQKRNRENGVRL
tara:strand:- start:586 stop:1155 length:570 start_codon:yes stop_codon:yes gene_type:complete